MLLDYLLYKPRIKSYDSFHKTKPTMYTTISRISPIILKGKVPFFSFRGPYFDYFFSRKARISQKKRKYRIYNVSESNISKKKDKKERWRKWKIIQSLGHSKGKNDRAFIGFLEASRKQAEIISTNDFFLFKILRTIKLLVYKLKNRNFILFFILCMQ